MDASAFSRGITGQLVDGAFRDCVNRLPFSGVQSSWTCADSGLLRR